MKVARKGAGLQNLLEGKTILVTGGTGSLGQVIVKKLLGMKPASVRIYSRNEYWQWNFRSKLEQETMGYLDPKKARFLIGDIRDKDRLYRAMNGVDYVIHTAALKHIDICAYNPIEAVKTNILGSINIIDCAIDNKVQNVLSISTDKAVHPINIYGASKLTMEKLMIQANVYQGSAFSCMRFGNIEASEGSVSEKWRKQSEAGQPLTITDKDMSRFFIGQSESADYAIRFIAQMQGGEIFIPKCREDNIYELARKLYPDSDITFIGIRPGEKLHEMLIAESEKPEDCGDYWVIK
jgi:UDP-N-acetylglucosamine 4,6-dehydratase